MTSIKRVIATAILVSLGVYIDVRSPVSSTEVHSSNDAAVAQRGSRTYEASDRLHPGMELTRGSVTLGSVTFTVPDRGEQAWAEVLHGDGSTEVIGVGWSPAGALTRLTDPEEAHSAAASSGSSGSSDPCKDGSYTKNGARWSRTYEWYFKARSTPRGVTKRQAARAFKRAARNITKGRNDCGLSPSIRAAHAYRGTTRTGTNISSWGSCRGRDRRSVVQFGSLPSGYLALSCWWTRNGRLVEADMRLNKRYYSWTVPIRSDCRNRWSVDAVATHEFGHIFGLGHVSGSTSPALTMAPLIRACQKSEATLGLGDVRGLESLY